MSTTPITSASGLASAAATASTQSGSTSSSGGAANEDIFLQLLVAQLKYQDPSNPASGTEFVTQLATFSQLQEDTESASDLDSMLGLMQSASTAASTGSAAASTGSTAASTGSTAASTGVTAASAAATAAAAAAASATASSLAAGTDLSGSTPSTSITGF